MVSSAQMAPKQDRAMFSRAQMLLERPSGSWAGLRNVSNAQVAPEHACVVFSTAQVAPEQACAVFSSAQVAPEHGCAVFLQCFH